jgi:hypothetical protein
VSLQPQAATSWLLRCLDEASAAGAYFVQLKKMGACMAVANSSKPLMDAEGIDGTDKDYYKKFVEDKVIGSGSFGVVKQVYHSDPEVSDKPFACKLLRKG